MSIFVRIPIAKKIINKNVIVTENDSNQKSNSMQTFPTFYLLLQAQSSKFIGFDNK